MRLIDADALKNRWTIPSPEPYNTDAAEVIDSIEEAPTVDAVEIGYCGSCRHASNELDKREPDDFCSLGERRCENEP